jgi:phenylpropionate dioxygenase-like ring-hydroxylating dioxygenase large terminal subunit
MLAVEPGRFVGFEALPYVPHEVFLCMSTETQTPSPFLSTFPGRYYYDPTLYAREQERIFSRMWVYVGHANSLPASGDYRVVQLANESVIVVRDKRGELRAFLNVCRHRGSRLCSEASGTLKGSIQCRYHAWTYALDGQLLGAPNVLNLENFDRTLYGLHPVALEVWQGMIWLNLSDNPPALTEQMADPVVHDFGGNGPIERYDIANLKVAHTITYDVYANWKLITENTLECYHCGPMHPELCDLLPMYRTGRVDNDEGASLGEDVEAFSITGKASRPPLPGLTQLDCRRYYGFFGMPNAFLNLLSDHVVIDSLQPIAPDHTIVTSEWLFDPSEMEKPDFNPLDAVEILDLVNRQDWVVCELAQQGMNSRALANGGNYAPLEQHIRQFVEYILAKL